MIQIARTQDWLDSAPLFLKHLTLKPLQRAIIKCNTTKDVMVNLPTGFGKSLLFQYPASLLHGRCIVVFVPLRALLWDCLKQAQQLGINAWQIDEQYLTVFEQVQTVPQILLLTPQRLFKNVRAMRHLHYLYEHAKITKFVIDQAHCISQWGSDFRPDYMQLCQLRQLFPGITILAMSATIPPQARNDLAAKLSLHNCQYFQASSNRPNLIYEVKKCAKQQIASEIKQYLNNKQLSNTTGIIYCQTIKNAQETVTKLSQVGIKCSLFHSKIPQSKREIVFNQFMNGNCGIIVATICFGMGVNKKNIRFVINVGISMSAENYYQESGRAGRDGQLSYCLLLTYKADQAPLLYLIDVSTKNFKLKKRRFYKIDQLKQYTRARQCRKHHLFKLLGQQFNAAECQTCDYCVSDKNKDIYYRANWTQKGLTVVKELQRVGCKITKNQLLNYVLGSRSNSIKNKAIVDKLKDIHGYLSKQKKQNVEILIDTLVEKKLLISNMEQVGAKKYHRMVCLLKACTKSQLAKHREIYLELPMQKDKQARKEISKLDMLNKYLDNKIINEKNMPLEKLSTATKTIQGSYEPELVELKQNRIITMSTQTQLFFMQLFQNVPEESTSTTGQLKDPEIGSLNDFNDGATYMDQIIMDQQDAKYYLDDHSNYADLQRNYIEDMTDQWRRTGQRQQGLWEVREEEDMNVSTGDKQEDEILMRMKKGEIDKNLLKDDRLEMVTKECDVKYGQSKRTSNLEELINKYSQYKDAFLDNDQRASEKSDGTVSIQNECDNDKSSHKIIPNINIDQSNTLSLPAKTVLRSHDNPTSLTNESSISSKDNPTNSFLQNQPIKRKLSPWDFY